MTILKRIGALSKYFIFIGMIAVHILSLYRGATTTAGIEHNILIWTYALLLSADIGELCSLLVLDRFNILLTGKTPNVVVDIWEESSEDVAVMHNGLYASTIFIIITVGLSTVSVITGNSIFSNIATIILILWLLGTVAYLFAGYLKVKQLKHSPLLSKLSNPACLPAIICMIQVLVTNKKWVGYIYRNIYSPQNDVLLAVALIIVLCYFLTVSFCHFTNVYCLVGFYFLKRDSSKIHKTLARLQENEDNREKILRKATKDLNEETEKVGLIKKCSLAAHYFFLNIKINLQEKFSAIAYLVTLINLKITTRFAGLLNPDRIKSTTTQFSLIVAVVELLSLDFLLFLYLESDSPCLKFFELFSTVIIIPILLSWLAEIKSKVSKGDLTSEEGGSE